MQTDEVDARCRDYREENVPDPRIGRRVLEQLDERFVDKRGRLQGVAGLLAFHERARNQSQLAVDERHQLVEGARLSIEDAWSSRVTWCVATNYFSGSGSVVFPPG